MHNEQGNPNDKAKNLPCSESWTARGSGQVLGP